MRYFAFLLIVLFAGCARIPKKDLQARLAPAVPLDEPESTVFDRGDWPGSDWWFMFDDPQLTFVVRSVIDENPTMHAAQMRAKKAVDEAFIVRSALFPHLSAGADVDWQHLSKDNLYRVPPSLLPAVIYQLGIGLELSYDFDIWGKNRQRFQAALGEAKAKAAETAETELMLSTAAASSYIDVQNSMEKLELYEALLQAQQDLLELENVRFASGLVDLRKVKFREAQVDNAREQVVANRERVTLGKHFMFTLMGQSPDSELEMVKMSAKYSDAFPLPEHLSLDLLARRPDITVRVWEVERSAHLIHAAKALFYPDLNLRMLGGLQSLSWTRWFTSDSLAGSFNPAIHLPIFVGGKLRFNLDARVAAFEEAVYEYNQVLLNAARDVSDKITQVESASQRLGDQNEVVDDVETIYDLTFARVRSGLDDQMNLLENDIELLRARIKQVEINDERLKHIVSLIKALGGGYQDHAHKQEEWAKDAS